jgi:hypothetical protein
MKERGNKFIANNEIDDAILNFVSYQAQEAILDPNLPESYKDEIVGAAVGTIGRIAEKRNAYHAKPNEKHQPKRSKTIYQAK